MLLEIFTALSAMTASSQWIAVAGSFLWGVASIVLSPCHLASIPLIVGYIGSQGKITLSRAAAISVFFASGILLTIAFTGIITGLAGRMLGDIGMYGNIAVAAIMIILGLYLTGIFQIPFLESGVNQPEIKRKGLLAAFFLGLFFGLALGPCTFAYMAPMLGIVFTVAASNFFYAAILIGAYAIGHCMVIILAGTFSEFVQNLVNWNADSKSAMVLKKLCGLLVVSAGLYMFFTSIRIFKLL